METDQAIFFLAFSMPALYHPELIFVNLRMMFFQDAFFPRLSKTCL